MSYTMLSTSNNNFRASPNRFVQKRAGSVGHSRSSTGQSFYSSQSNPKQSFDKTIAIDTQNLLYQYKKDKETLKAEKDMLMNKYESKLTDICSFVRSLLSSVDRLLKNTTVKSLEENFAVSMLERDRKILSEALVRDIFASRLF